MIPEMNKLALFLEKTKMRAEDAIQTAKYAEFALQPENFTKICDAFDIHDTDVIEAFQNELQSALKYADAMVKLVDTLEAKLGRKQAES